MTSITIEIRKYITEDECVDLCNQPIYALVVSTDKIQSVLGTFSSKSEISTSNIAEIIEDKPTIIAKMIMQEAL